MYKNFDNWEDCEGFSYGSGTSSQKWITNKITGQIALFKDRKSDDTTDNFSEKIASDIAKIIGLPCAEVDLAIWNGRIGMVSYKINSENEHIIEGIQYISSIYPYYNRDTLIDEKTDKKYSIEMILKSIEELGVKKDLFKIFIFDFIIGNSDRHHSNWAILRDDYSLKVCPVYDNASSLCSYITDTKIDEHYKDRKWIDAIIDSKSKSLIRINNKKVKHSDFIKYLKENYYEETIEFVKKIKEKFNYDVIENLINRYKNELSDNKIKLLKIYLKGKLDLLIKIYEIS